MVVAHVGGEDDGALRAFNAATGRLIWSWNGDGPGYASPIIGEFEGVAVYNTFYGLVNTIILVIITRDIPVLNIF